MRFFPSLLGIVDKVRNCVLFSMEKIRPEKELERATKEILRRKFKIRDLFQHLDTLCAEGSLPESLFDSDGEICSEDVSEIYTATHSKSP